MEIFKGGCCKCGCAGAKRVGSEASMDDNTQTPHLNDFHTRVHQAGETRTHSLPQGSIASSMPRIRPRDIWKARETSKTLLSLLPVCRDIASARNELRWLRQHAIAVSQQTEHHNPGGLLRNLIIRRAHGEPLQYVLGSEFFGGLEIRVRAGVLIPR